MTIVVIGPVTQDLIITGECRQYKTGGASYFQSFVFEKFYPDYIAIVNCENAEMAREFPNPDKVKVIKKDNTHFFINNYPNADNSDFRIQSSNFANIAITSDDLKGILSEIKEIDAFILNPLNAFDFPIETIDYLKSFNVKIYISLQGFLRRPSHNIDEDTFSIDLKYGENVKDSISGIDGLFLDELEASILFEENDFEDFVIDEIVITDGSNGSRVISESEYKISAVECDNVVDSTGCGDTFMAAYLSKKIKGESIIDSANFASKIASDKLGFFGPLL